MALRFCLSFVFAIALTLGLLTPSYAALTAVVKAEANIRSEPRVAPATVLGQVCVGDRVTILETKTVNKATWYRVEVTLLSSGACKVSKHIAVHTKGWLSSTILTRPVEAKDQQGQPAVQPTSRPAPTATPAPAETKQCDPSYPDYCIPPDSPDLDCSDISRKNITVLPPDPHRLDRDKDGIGCES